MIKKKIQTKVGLITALALGVSVSQPTQAALNCPATVGDLINGVDSGTYCVSKINMTWWSAFTWCAAIGGKLATWAEACPGRSVGSSCSNLNGAGGPDKWAWTAEPINPDRAYVVNPSSGSGNGNFGRNPNFSALCR